MPLARILTQTPEYTTTLSQQLREQGFEVEVARSGDAIVSPADLEIEFEVCDQQQALRRAAELARQLQSEVVVFPGTVRPTTNAATIQRTPVVEAIPAIPRVTQPATPFTERLERPAPLQQPTVQETPLPPIQPTHAAPVTGSPLPLNDPPARLSENQLAQNQTAQDQSVQEPPVQNAPVQNAPAQAQPHNEPSVVHAGLLDNVGSEVRASLQQTGAAFGEARHELGAALGSAGQKLRNGLTRLRERASSGGVSMTQRAQEYRERMKAHAAELQAARERRSVELEKERAAEQEKAEALEHQRRTQRKLDEAVQQELLERERIEREERQAELERSKWAAQEHAAALEAQRRKEHEQQEEPELKPEKEVAAPVLVPAAQPPMPKHVKTVRRKRWQLNGVLTGAIAASFLFLVGLTLANFRPWPPLPSDLTRGSVQQELPFGAATVHAATPVSGPSSAHAAPLHTTAPPNASTPRPQPQMRAAKASPSVGATPKPQPQHRRLSGKSRRSDSNTTADDVVVRHFGAPPAPAKNDAQQQTKLKHYSDIQ